MWKGRRLLVTALLVGVWGFACGGVAGAQPPASATAPKPVADLKTALDHTAWNSAERGPIIAVAPEQVRPSVPRRDLDKWFMPPPVAVPLFPPPDGGRHLNIEATARYFGSRVVRMGSLVAVAPAEMTVLNTKLDPPDPLRDMDGTDKLRLLQASLSAAQWRLLGSADGLGADNLDTDQRKVFMSLVPQPLRLVRGIVSATGQTVFDTASGADPSFVLSDNQRRGVRLRLNRAVQYTLMAGPDEPRYEAMLREPPAPAGTPVVRMTAVAYKTGVDGEAFGQFTHARVASYLKPGELDREAPVFAVDLSLAGVKTVGDAIKLLRDKTGVEMYCDGRAAAFALYISDTTVPVRASDLLKALCWGVSGTFRKLGPDSSGKVAFVLTDDIEGIGARQARIERWMQTGYALANQLRERLNAQIRAQQPLQYLDFASGDALALTPDAMKKVESQWTAKRSRLGTILPVSLLNLAQKTRVEAAIKEFYERTKDDPKHPVVLPDQVEVSVHGELRYLIPGEGEAVSNDTFLSIETMLPPPASYGMDWEKGLPSGDPFALPATMKAGGSLLTDLPATDDAADALFALAKQKGMGRVWLDTDAGNVAIERLKYAAQRGTSYGVAVYALVHLMQTDSAFPVAMTGLVADVNILGETGQTAGNIHAKMPVQYEGDTVVVAPAGDWLLPQDTHTLPYILRHLEAIAAVPGLAGIALEDAAAPGYHTTALSPYDIGLNTADFGYMPDNRLAFLRANNYDPIDLVMRTNNFGGANTIPHFAQPGKITVARAFGVPRSGEASNRWATLRYEKQARLLGDVFAGFRAQHPALPLYLRSLGDQPVGMFVQWEKADALPRLVSDARGNPIRLPEFGHTLSQEVLAHLPLDAESLSHASTYVVDKTPPGTPQRLAYQLRVFLGAASWGGKPDAWDGVVIDIRRVPLRDALPLLQGGLANPPQQDKPVAEGH